MIVLTLPLAPTINHYYGQRPRGGRYIKPAGQAFRLAVAEIVADAGHKLIEGRVALFATIHPANKRKQDIDNRAKALQDALTHAGVWLDDEQIDDLHLVRGEVIKGGRVVAVITEIKGGVMDWLKVHWKLINDPSIGMLSDAKFMQAFRDAAVGKPSALSKYVIPCFDRMQPQAWAEVRKAIYERDKGICTYCGKPSDPFHVDHIFPLARGGTNDESNLTTACAPCNLSKGDKTIAEWIGEK